MSHNKENGTGVIADQDLPQDEKLAEEPAIKDGNEDKKETTNVGETNSTAKEKPGLKSKCSQMNLALASIDLSECSAEFAIDMLRNPSWKLLSSLNRRLKNADPDWAAEFLDGDGFKVLFDLVESLSNCRVTKLADAMLLLENVACVKTIMNSQIGMDYFISHPESGNKLVKALDTNNTILKKQVFELLSALIAYSHDGFELALKALEHYKLSKKQKYRFSVVISEMRNNNELPSYWAVIMGFVNCIVLANGELEDRVKIRNEFLGLKILELLDAEQEYLDEEFDIQCEVFYEEMHLDDEDMCVFKPEGIDISDHRQLFENLFAQIGDKPQALNLLNILQCMQQINNDDADSDTIWIALEDTIQKTIFLGLNKTKKQRIPRAGSGSSGLRSRSGSQLSTEEIPREGENATSRAKQMQHKLSLKRVLTAESIDLSMLEIPSSESDTDKTQDKIGENLVPPPGGSLEAQAPQCVLPAPGLAPAPPPLHLFHAPIKGIQTPKPNAKMKTINWTKVPASFILDDSVVWKEVLAMTDYVPVQYEKLEELFSKKIIQQQKEEEVVKKKTPTVINLLDLKRSMIVNIILKQFKATNEDIINMITDCNKTLIGPDKLRGLITILPDKGELEMITSFEGDTEQLGSAENFYYKLSSVSHFQVRMEGLLVKLEFQENYDSLKLNLSAVSEACQAILDNHSLKEFLRYALHSGNFINAGGYAGNALGFKINSLSKFMEIGSNKPRMTLLHYLVGEAITQNKDVIEFVVELLPLLEKSDRLVVDDIRGEVKMLERDIEKLVKDLSSCSEDLKKQFGPFIQNANAGLESLYQALASVDGLRNKLAQHFCEDKTKFKIEECLEIYKTFCDNIKKCEKENDNRKLQEERAERRKKEHQVMLEKKKAGNKEQLVVPAGGCIIDNLLSEIKKGTTLRRTKKLP